MTAAFACLAALRPLAAFAAPFRDRLAAGQQPELHFARRDRRHQLRRPRARPAVGRHPADHRLRVVNEQERLRVALLHHPVVDRPGDDARPAYAELEHLADDLPATERAAVVLRYGYDLPYTDIAAALGSTEAAARQAASPGVRRLRRRIA